MIKVCHLTSVHPPFDIRIFYKECSSLADAGFEVTLIAPIKEEIIKNSVKIIPIILPKSRFKRIMTVTIKMWRLALKTKSQLFHFHDPELLFCGILLKISGKKVIFDIHENVRLSIKSKHWLPVYLSGIVKFLYYLLERSALLFFDALVFAENSYEKYYPMGKGIVVLNYPLLLDDSVQKKDFDSVLRFVYTGGILEKRGVWEMLYLATQLKKRGIKLHFDMIGQIWPDILEHEIDRYLIDNDLISEVTVHRRVDFKEIPKLLEKMHIGLALLHPIDNYIESLPTKIFEYMQLGLPVITNNFPLYRRYVEEENTGLCIDIKAIEDEVDAVFNFINDKPGLKIISSNGIKLIKNKFNWNSEKTKLVNLYTNILN